MEASQRYTQEAVERALDVVRSKQMSLRKASKVFGIPYATLGDKLRGRRPVTASPRTVLTSEEEIKLVKWMVELSKRGFGRTRNDMRDMVKRILDDRGEKTVFKDNRPGKAWIAAFFKRHPELSERMSLALGKERAVVTRDTLKSWFEEMKLSIDAVDPTILTSPDRLFNADESGFSICPKTKKVISMTGTKHVYSVTSGSRQQVTVLACISAIGHYLPPLLIFPFSRDPRFNAMEGFEEVFFQRTPNGWITEEVFLSFLKDIFLPFLQGKRPVVLFVDGHSSHHSLAISDLCSENGVMPPLDKLLSILFATSYLPPVISNPDTPSPHPKKQKTRKCVFVPSLNFKKKSFSDLFVRKETGFPEWVIVYFLFCDCRTLLL